MDAVIAQSVIEPAREDASIEKTLEITAGNTILVCVISDGKCAGKDNIKDDLGNVYVRKEQKGNDIAVFAAYNCKGGTTTITYLPSFAATDICGLAIVESTPQADDGTSTDTKADINLDAASSLLTPTGDISLDAFVDYARVAVGKTEPVLVSQEYGPGAYEFGPTPIAPNATSITFHVDTGQHTDPNVTVDFVFEISFDGGKNWTRLGGFGRTGEEPKPFHGFANNRGGSQFALEQPDNPDRQFRGTMQIGKGGSLITSLGMVVS
jgi:hypothetical protein